MRLSKKNKLLIAEQIYITEAGILNNILEFKGGEDIDFFYNFNNEKYSTLISNYKLTQFAKGNSEFEVVKTLVNEFAPRLIHKDDYDNHIEIDALSLLKYSLNNKRHGINCRSKAQILNEMCLALCIYARKVWLMPNSKYDSECHVVNEIWDTKLNKWIMLDITNSNYWVDESGTPLSILEIRYKGAKNEFCTPVSTTDNLTDLKALKKRYIGNFLYIMKNMAYMEYFDNYTVGEGNKIWLLVPENLKIDYNFIISESAITKSPKT